MLLLSLRQVPEDEANEVKALLAEQGIAFYETPPSFWGVSAGGIWLQHAAQKEEAQMLLARYQQQRAESARASWQAQRAEGNHTTQWQMIQQHPVRFTATIVGVILLFAVMTLPFWGLK